MTDTPAAAANPWPLQVFGLEARRLGMYEKLALGAGLILTFVVFLVSLQDIGRYAGIDFRNRIVGARAMLAGYDPYTFEWQPGMPLELLDPIHDEQVHRLTAPPPTLFPYSAIAPLPYKVQRLLSCLLEWLALGVSISLLTRTIADHRQRVLFLLFAIVFFVLSDFWRLHVERGQVYVFHLLVLSLANSLCLRGGLNSWSGGILFGVAVLMRPNYLLVIPAFLILRHWRTALGGALTFGLGVLATLPFMHPDSWKNYARVGEQYYVTLWNAESLPKRPPPAYEGLVEGVDFRRHLDGITSTSFAVFYQRWQEGGILPVVNLGLVSKAAMVGLALVLYCLLLRRRTDLADPRLALALILAFALDTEYFLPHRWGYVDVVLLLPLGLLWPSLWEQRPSSYVALTCVFLGFMAGMCLTQHLSLYYATLARSWLTMAALTLVALSQAHGLRPVGPRSPAAPR